MIYEEFPEWKQLKREKKYVEAVEKLIYEIAVNLMRVSNLYCERKYDPYEEYCMAYSAYYGKNMNGRREEKLHNFMDISCELSCYRIYLDDSTKEDDIPYHCKYLIEKLKKSKKELIQKMNKISKDDEVA